MDGEGLAATARISRAAAAAAAAVIAALGGEECSWRSERLFFRMVRPRARRRAPSWHTTPIRATWAWFAAAAAAAAALLLQLSVARAHQDLYNHATGLVDRVGPGHPAWDTYNHGGPWQIVLAVSCQS